MGSSDPSNTGPRGYAFEDIEVLDRIGAGGTADVYRARIDGVEGDRRIALKTPRLSDYETVEASFFDDFVEEASIWNRLDDHEGIVDVLDWGTEPYPWIAMEYMDAGHLGDRAPDLPLERRVDLFADVCDAVFHAHRHGITHGDLKPENVLLTRSDGELVPKVGDWGLATVLLEHSRSRDGLTMAYSAPEQIDPDTHGRTDDRTDIYQLSAVAYELFTGSTPFDAAGTGELVHRILHDRPTPPSERADVPAPLDDAILTGLERDREDRYETVLYLRDAVEEAMSAGRTTPDGTATDDRSGPADDPDDTEDDAGRSVGGGPATEPDVGTTADATSTTDGRTVTESATSDEGRGPSDPTETGTVTLDAASDDAESGGLIARLHRPVESLATGRGVAASVAFAVHYPRSIDRRTLRNWWAVVLASTLVVPAPLVMGFVLEAIRGAADGRALEFRLGDGAWADHYRRGLVGYALPLGPFLLFAAVAEPGGAAASATTAEGLAATLTLVSWVLLPGLLSTYATGGLSALATQAHWRGYATRHYVGTFAGTLLVGVIAYFVATGLALTIVGIVVAYLYPMVAVGGFLGRRVRPAD
ncbi:hypothetical protein EI982_06520 [Haloplanus rallus]|uniref:Protein kinase domain-containing protein n=1 Tax=Haloplanus rallus TaxID=1816183 RepID=A0A6B9F7X3_9EURY|nr:serine/threonine-protein kinase [Haloplanus rallus]QGX94464.1 hypothetical protein EI982_06520 [Haloplanus rallus]